VTTDEPTKLLCQSTNCRPTDRGGPREVEPSRPLCRNCADWFGRNLTQIAEMLPDLRGRLGVEGKAGEKLTGTKLPGIVINEEVSDLLAELTEWARYLAKQVRRYHKLTQPPQSFDVDTLLVWLAKYHAWRLAHHDDRELAVYVVDCAAWYRSEIQRMAYPSGSRRFDIPGGVCRVMVVPDDAIDGHPGYPCVGQLYAIVRDGASLLPSEIVCDRNADHRIPSGQWVQYARQLEKAGHASGSDSGAGVPDGG